MVDTRRMVETAREAGNLAIEILEIGFEPASYNCPEDEEGDPLLDEDPRYWQNFTEMKETLQSFGEVEVEDQYLKQDHSMGLRATKEIDGEEFSHFYVGYGADGGNVIVVEFKMDGGWYTVIDHHSPDLSPVQVGRYVARAELTILANRLGSSTETLDYWMVEASDYHDSKTTQSLWAKHRGVSKQAVSDNVNSAKRTLNQS